MIAFKKRRKDKLFVALLRKRIGSSNARRTPPKEALRNWEWNDVTTNSRCSQSLGLRP
jgi:hypothetical protein